MDDIQMTKSGTHRFLRQDRLVWGDPADVAVSRELALLGKQRAFVICNASLMATDLVSRIVSRLGPQCVGIYDKCVAHSPRKDVLAASRAARMAGADIIVAIGGGSVIDTSKVVLACLWLNLETEQDMDNLRDGNFSDRLHAVRDPIRMVAVPTTLSGAEFSTIAGITNAQRGTKEVLQHPDYVPSIVVIDPAATRFTPPELFSSSGIRAVDHCVEAICSTAPTPYADAVTGKALEMLSRHLVAATTDSANFDSRLECQMAAWLATSGLASGVPIGLSHVIGRVLGGAHHVPHGVTSCVMLAPVLRWNESADDGRQAIVAKLLGADPGQSAADAVASLIARLELPARLRDVGVERRDFAGIAEKALHMTSLPGCNGNPRTANSLRDIEQILELAY
nr:iron-containing alcohol dehydrogenase [Paraburkholderia sp. BL8N3]